MKRLNFNIKDRKVLTLGLCLILVCVFTLTIAYAALNAVLTIQGSARVTAADWDIYLNNPRVTNGSATIDVPEIKTSSTLEFSTTLNMPGDFYEFTVDVVNGGSIDAMIENVVKTPELTTEQAKFLKYEITYQNGESITTKQVLAKETTMPIKVRIEYRRDISSSDLPTTSTTLDLALTLEYVQSDGTGSSVNNNGAEVKLVTADGDINAIGTVVTIGSEQFYTIGTEGDNVKLLSMMNITLDENPVQSSSAGNAAFSNTSTVYSGSIVEGYVNNYKNALETNLGVEVVEARLIKNSELTNSSTFACSYGSPYCKNSPYPWIYSTSYWASTYNTYFVSRVESNGEFGYSAPEIGFMYGVRPVIIISKSYF